VISDKFLMEDAISRRKNGTFVAEKEMFFNEV
jgi:hypothetical protein